MATGFSSVRWLVNSPLILERRLENNEDRGSTTFFQRGNFTLPPFSSTGLRLPIPLKYEKNSAAESRITRSVAITPESTNQHGFVAPTRSLILRSASIYRAGRATFHATEWPRSFYRALLRKTIFCGWDRDQAARWRLLVYDFFFFLHRNSITTSIECAKMTIFWIRTILYNITFEV